MTEPFNAQYEEKAALSPVARATPYILMAQKGLAFNLENCLEN